MKKLIAIASISLSVAFAFALANAEETTSKSTTTTTQEPASMDPQSAAKNAADEAKNTADKMSSDASREAAKISKSSKICTDDKGVTYKKDEEGFKACMDTMNKKNGQMGGEASTTTETHKSMESSGSTDQNS